MRDRHHGEGVAFCRHEAVGGVSVGFEHGLRDGQTGGGLSSTDLSTDMPLCASSLG
ncbi:MAG TPA: hypothetical protein VFN66_10355 [Burkholderiales bacterium]|nr:hypothetical protein [Burkholderiales bacterium]